MKKLVQSAFLVLLMASSFIVTQAQIPTLRIDEAQARKNEQERERIAERATLFGDFVNACRRGTYDELQMIGKEYMERYPEDKEQILYINKCLDTKKLRPYLVPKWKKLCQTKQYNEFLPIAKQILSVEPNNLPVLFCIWRAGFDSARSNDYSHSAEFIAYGKQIISVLKTYKTQTDVRPFKDRDEALAYVNFLIGLMYSKTDSHTAIDYLYDSAQYNSTIKKDPSVYLQLAKAYQSEFEKIAGKIDLSDPQKTVVKTPLSENILDCWLDALARAFVYSRDAKSKETLGTLMTQVYKSLNYNTDGLEDYLNNIKNKPMPKLE